MGWRVSPILSSLLFSYDLKVFASKERGGYMPVDFGLGNETYFGQFNVKKHDISRGILCASVI